MKRLLILLSILGFGLSVFAQNANPREMEIQEGDTTYVMKQYFMVLLLRGDQAETFTDAALAKIQEAHLAHINKMAKAGQVLIAGPFGDDTEKRGILIFDVETQEMAEALANDDPAVKAGRLKVECHPWWTAKGSVLK